MRRPLAFSGGQASVEYALVLLAFLSLLVAFCALWNVSRQGSLVQIARDNSSHNLAGESTVGFVLDLEAY